MGVSKILIISSPCGAAHKVAAKALESAFRAKHPQISVNVIDSLDYAPKVFAKWYVGSYKWMVDHFPTAWRYIYNHYDKEKRDRIPAKLRHLFFMRNLQGMVQYIEEFAPDCIICTQFLPTEIVADLKRKGKIGVPTYATVLDYYVNMYWVHEGIDRYFVGSEKTKWVLSRRGFDENAIDAFGIPVNPVYSEKLDRETTRHSLKLDEGKTTVMVGSGARADRGVEKIVDAIAALGRTMQVLVVTGWNERLRMKLEKKEAPEHITLKTFGFESEMHELMEASDLAVTKAGGMTISECLATGLPMLVFAPAPGQEERNSDFIVEAGAAVRVDNLANLRYKLTQLLDDKDKLRRMEEAALYIARPDAAIRIVDRVMEE